MEQNQELEKLSLSVRAVEHWVKVLYATVGLPAEMVLSHIQQLKNQAPQDGMNPHKYDEFSMKMIPAIEAVGQDLAAYLQDFHDRHRSTATAAEHAAVQLEQINHSIARLVELLEKRG